MPVAGSRFGRDSLSSQEKTRITMTVFFSDNLIIFSSYSTKFYIWLCQESGRPHQHLSPSPYYTSKIQTTETGTRTSPCRSSLCIAGREEASMSFCSRATL
ncbi:hypothetical protein K435DRAFT_254712 [Dendrothele bispora CBS 962.96]|uniref:Uncharacterized protein n=1 Tax=Dendrothele bispora (strain CBS 962.96) TaxID=1314807 RepID=A0A4S8LNG3_DENBC|nr:hypothetical protein K435DRAFT_324906 [Dendrothele bispora CBS 962.96]THU90671.1 hypothetical protein K435DRAFT_254712 [Dendrothele bispora CBS 962.96]